MQLAIVTVVGRLSRVAAGYATAAPVAVYLLAVWVLHVRPYGRGAATWPFLTTSALVLLTPFTPVPVRMIALLLAVLVAITVITSPRASGPGEESPQRHPVPVSRDPAANPAVEAP